MTISGFYPIEVIGSLRAAGILHQWNRNAVSPIGFRHWESGEYRASAKVDSFIGGMTSQKESGVALDFGQVNVENSGFLTDTVVLTFNLGEVNSNPNSFFDHMVAASSVGTNFKAFNMKFWQGNLEAFTSVSGTPQPVFHFVTSPTWRRGFQVDISDLETKILPSSLPISGNILNDGADVFISGNYVDTEFSDFIYLRGQFASGNYALGTYGGLGNRDFTFNFSYDWTDIDANVLPTDLLQCVTPALPPISFPAVGPGSGLSIPSGMISYYNLDENSPRLDLWGNTHLQGGLGVGGEPSRVSGVSSNTNFAAQFERINLEYLTASGISADNRLRFGNSDFTITAWTYLDSKTNSGGVVSKWNAFNNEREYLVLYETSTDRFVFGISSDGATNDVLLVANTFGSPPTGQWIFVYCEYDSVNDLAGISINNGAFDTTSYSLGAFVGNADFEIGSVIFGDGSKNSLDGRIDSVGVWNRLLTDSERTFLYSAGSGLQMPFDASDNLGRQVKSYWRLNEAGGFPRFDIIEGARLEQTGTVLPADGIIGSGANFVAASSPSLSGTPGGLVFPQFKNFTASAWVNMNDVSGMRPILSKWESATNKRSFRLDYDGGVSNRFRFLMSHNGAAFTTVHADSFGPAASGDFNLVTVWHDANDTINIQVNNGGIDSAAHILGVHTVSNHPIEIGSADGEFMDGIIDEVGVWNRILSSEERAKLYRNGLGNEWPFISGFFRNS